MKEIICNTRHYVGAYDFEHTAVALDAEGGIMYKVSAIFTHTEDGRYNCCIVDDDWLSGTVSLARGQADVNKAFTFALVNANAYSHDPLCEDPIYWPPGARGKLPQLAGIKDGEPEYQLAADEEAENAAKLLFPNLPAFDDEEEPHFPHIDIGETLKKIAQKRKPGYLVFAYQAGSGIEDWGKA